MGFIGLIIIGGLAGWVGSMIMGRSHGLIVNIVVGIIGAFIGGFVFNLLGGTGITGFNFWSFIVALVGSIILIWLLSLFGGNRAEA